MNFTKYMNSFENELKLIHYSKQTIATYLSCVKKMLVTINNYPERINQDEIKKYLINLINNNCSPSLVSQNIGALQLFYKLVVKQPKKLSNIQRPRKTHKLIDVLSVSEVEKLINSINNLKHKTITVLLYDCALRISEVINLKLSDIKRDRNLLLIRQGKGNKDRFVTLHDNVIQLLIKYYYQYKPSEYVFNGQFQSTYSDTSIRSFLKKYAKQARIKQFVYPHLLRHSKLTHLHESGQSLRTIQHIAGHRHSTTTERYTHISNKFISDVQPTIKFTL